MPSLPPGSANVPASEPAVKRALFYSAGGAYFQLVLQTVTTLVVARLITPADMALFAIGSALVALIQVLRDFGIASFVITEKELTDRKLSTAFVLSIGLCWSLAAVLFVLSGYTGRFYEHQGVTQVVRVLCLGIALVPFGAIPQAVMHRNFDFRSIFVINAVAAVTHAATSIWLASLGYAHMALAWASVGGVAATAATTWLVSPRTFKFTLPLDSFGRLFSFGSQMTQIEIIKIVFMRSPELVLGKFLALTQVGIFDRANGVLDMFNRMVTQAVDPLVMPYFSHKQRQGADLGAANVGAASTLTTLAAPFFVCVAFLAEPLIYVLFGSQWVPAAQYVPLLCVAAIIKTPITFAGRLVVTLNRLDLSKRAFILTTVVQVSGLLLTARYGLYAVCLGLIVTSFFHSLIWGGLIAKLLGTSAFPQAIKAAWMPSLAAAAASALSREIAVLLTLPPLGLLCVAAVLVSGTWLLSLWAARNPLFGEMVQVLRAIKQRLLPASVRP